VTDGGASRGISGAAGLDAEARRLLWRCRRGMKELDILLERFASAHLAACGRRERDEFARFLELPDPVLAGYLLTPTVALEPAFARLARAIIAHDPRLLD
jgi:antitoxin CptB